MSAPFTGPTKELGEEIRLGAETYFNQYNAQQNKHQILLTPLDDGYEPERTAKNTDQFIQQKMFALFGYVGTPTTAQVLPVIQKFNTILFAPFTGAEFLHSPVKRNIFNVRASYYQEAETQVQYFVDHLKHKRVAVFMQADEFGLEASKGFLIALAKRQISPEAIVRYKRNTENITSAVKRLSQLNVDVIFCVGTYQPISALVSQLRAAKATSSVSALSFTGAESFRAHLTHFENVFISSVMPNPHESTLPIVVQYRQHMKDNQLSHESLEGYVNAVFFSKILDMLVQSVTPDEFIRVADSLQLSYGGMSFSYGIEDRQGLSHAFLNQVTRQGLRPVNYYASF